jgi:competence protein ComEC
MLGAGAHLLSLPLFISLILFFLVVLRYAQLAHKTIYLIAASLLALFGFIYTFLRDCPSLQQSSQHMGKGVFHVIEKRQTTLFGKKSLLYKGTLKQFTDNKGRIYKPMPCYLSRPLHAPLCCADQIAFDAILLIVKDRRSFSIKIDKTSLGTCYNKTTLAEKRYKAKMSLLEHLKKRYKDKKTLSFISAMTVGYIDNKTLMYEFSKTGIQHLLTISGFHFGLLVIFLAVFLRPFFSKPLFICALIISLTCYVIYLGPSPSVSRSWIAAILMLIAYYLEIPAQPINYLSVAGLIAFLENPLCLTNLGFQLSYLATFGIISYFTVCDRWMQLLLVARPVKTLCSLPTKKQLFCLFLIFIRKSLSLDHAVNLITLPVIYYHFGSFPVYSFYFNLLIPILLLPSLYLLMIGLLCTPILPLETALHNFNNSYTKCILDSVAACPKILETSLTIKNVNATTAVVAVLIIFLSVLVINKNQSK